MRVVSLASGSSGNALFIEAGPGGRTRLLVDAGIGMRVLTQRLQSLGVHPSQLQGVVLTHEHSDHVQALPALFKRYTIPLVADPRTIQAVEAGLRAGAWRSDSGRLIFTRKEVETTAVLQSTTDENTGNSVVLNSREVVETFQPSAMFDVAASSLPVFPTRPLPAGSSLIIGDIEVTSFPVSHDASAPCGYLLQAGGFRVCLITDSGEVTPVMLTHIQQADLLVLESNHDRERLMRGPYPWYLKQRILSATGHLSNTQAADAVLQTWPQDGIRWLWLAHLSRTNNTPTLALESMRRALRAAGAPLEQLHISALPPGMGTLWDSTRLWHMSSLWTMQ